MYCDKENINILTALLVSHGVKHVVICPGSRNAPMAHNFNECPEIICHSITDERSATFYALGIRQQTQTPVAVCVTSGSALLNTLPGSAEATYQQQGLIIISADRPAEWIGQNDGQTMPQQNALGCFVAKSITINEPHNNDERWMCNRLVNEALITNNAQNHPSVHINVPIAEPLFSFTTPQLPKERVVRMYEWNNTIDKEHIRKIFTQAERRMIIVGQYSRNSLLDKALTLIDCHAVLLTEPISCDGEAITPTDQMLSLVKTDDKTYHPDCVIYIGGNTISKRLRHFMRALDKNVTHINITTDGELHDISKNTTILINADPAEIIDDLHTQLPAHSTANKFCSLWKKLQYHVIEKTEQYNICYSQMMAVKEFECSVRNNAHAVYYANSMAIRLAALFAKQYRFCNRGLNGIEGSLSVAVGAATAAMIDGHKENVYCVIGDLSFFYDENALWQKNLTPNLRILLLNNGTGGIFSMLNGIKQSSAFEGLINGKHNITAEGVCRQFGVEHVVANDATSLRNGLQKLININTEKAVLLEVITDAETDNTVFSEFYENLKQIQS